MADVLATEFDQILDVLKENEHLRNEVLALVESQPMPGKVTEGGDRLSHFRTILAALISGDIGLPDAFTRTQRELQRESSMHSGNNRVFAAQWTERLVRTQLSRFYNQAVMERLLAEGETHCFVPHSSSEDSSSPCSVALAGKNHEIKILHERLVASYSEGDWAKVVKIPDHPYCTHVVTKAK